MLAAVTSGAMFFRIYLALWAIYGTRRHLTTFYGLELLGGLAIASITCGNDFEIQTPCRKARLALIAGLTLPSSIG